MANSQTLKIIWDVIAGDGDHLIIRANDLTEVDEAVKKMGFFKPSIPSEVKA